MEPYSSSSSTPDKSLIHTAVNRNKRKQLHTAPLPPNPPKVYKVDPANFRDLVQRLTGSSFDTVLFQPQPPQQRKLAPPPLEQTAKSSAGETSPLTAMCRELMMDDVENSLELNLSSPAAGVQYSWYPPMLSNAAGNL
ncbi:hypothetical protein LINPERHAP1_LOCUS27394 [Linum perenne]